MPIKRHEKLQQALVPIISVLLGFLLGGLIMLAFGHDPILGYKKMFETVFFKPNTSEINLKNIGEVFVTAGPLIFTALGFAVANMAGFFNIGLSGQALAGWVASIWVALGMEGSSKLVVIPAAILAGVLAGSIAAAIPGFLRAFFGTSEVIVTIMMNYILLYTSTHIVNNVYPPAFIRTKGTTKVVESGSLRLPFLTEWTQGSRINLGIFLAIIFLGIVWFITKKTTLGYEIRAVGLNPDASEYAGISSKKTIIVSMMISGALAGFGGVVYGLGTFGNFFIQGSSLSIGFDGMAVSLLGGGTSVGIFLSALLFSVLKLGGQGMQFAGIPPELVDVDIAIIIFFVAISFVIRYGLGKLFGYQKETAKKLATETTEIPDNDKGGQL